MSLHQRERSLYQAAAAKFVGGELSKVAQTIPDWVSRLFGKELHSAKQHENAGRGRFLQLIVGGVVLGVPACRQSPSSPSSDNWTTRATPPSSSHLLAADEMMFGSKDFRHGQKGTESPDCPSAVGFGSETSNIPRVIRRILRSNSGLHRIVRF